MRPLLTVEQASHLLKIHPETCRKKIRNKEIKASKVFGKWKIAPSNLESLINSNQNVVAQEVRHKESLCQTHSRSISGVTSGGTDSLRREVEKEYSTLLGL